ncbi:MAG: hypothetical protein ABSG80_00665 [Verrucomicrobiota bacterium]|jgi:hypothetical protein
MHPSHFYKYHTASVAKIVLATQKVRWNSPLNFNDPFDCFFSLDPKFDISQMVEKRRERFLDLMTQDKEPDFDPRNPYISYLIAVVRPVCPHRSMSSSAAPQKISARI